MFSRPIFISFGLALGIVCGDTSEYPGKRIYPEDYGAVGDGVSDDGPPIAAACSAAATTRIPLSFRQKYRLAGSTSLRCDTAYLAGAILVDRKSVV